MKTTYIYIALVVIVIGGLVIARNYGGGGVTNRVSAYDGFAQCLSDAGAKFYGAYWCPHCQDQKKLFDNSSKIPYIECSTPNGQGQNAVCTELGIEGYPTWIFSDGTRTANGMTLEELSEKTACTL